VIDADSRRYEETERLTFQTLGLPHDEAARLEEARGRQDPLWVLYLSAERSLWKVEWEQAARSFAEVLRRDPGSPLAVAGLVYLFSSERIAGLTEIAARWPTLERPLLYLGWSHLADGRYEEAATVLERCTVMAPEDPLAWLQLSAALIEVGDRRKAADAAEGALRAGPDSFRTRRSAAHLLYRAGRRRRALRVAAETARRTPEIRAWLLPLTLPLQVSRPLWLVVVILASVLLGAGKAPGPEFRWWALAAGFAVGALLVAASFSSDSTGQTRRSKRFVRARERLRDELDLPDGYGPDLRATYQPTSIS
jgi:tetratricopeptide (TPR) repeat protein